MTPQIVLFLTICIYKCSAVQLRNACHALQAARRNNVNNSSTFSWSIQFSHVPETPTAKRSAFYEHKDTPLNYVRNKIRKCFMTWARETLWNIDIGKFDTPCGICGLISCKQFTCKHELWTLREVKKENNSHVDKHHATQCYDHVNILLTVIL